MAGHQYGGPLSQRDAYHLRPWRAFLQCIPQCVPNEVDRRIATTLSSQGGLFGIFHEKPDLLLHSIVPSVTDNACM